jgi:hypothetical protein
MADLDNELKRIDKLDTHDQLTEPDITDRIMIELVRQIVGLRQEIRSFDATVRQMVEFALQQTDLK